jgi:predicted glycogen debranching enzyme
VSAQKAETMTPNSPQNETPLIEFGRDICGELETAEQREWLVTSGIGGYASGTVAGLATRRYHGYLVAALKPPLGRTVLVSGLDENVQYAGRAFDLSTNRWAGGTIAPAGYKNIERFRLENGVPVWTFAFADALLEKRVWMQQGANTTYIRYDLVRGTMPAGIAIKALVNYRDYHSSTHAGDWRMNIQPAKNGVKVQAFDGATPFYLLSSGAAAKIAHEWYRDFDLAEERFRGLDDREDHLHAATFKSDLQPGESMTLVAGLDPSANLDGDATWNEFVEYQKSLLEKAAGAGVGSSDDPAWIRQMVLAADQFIVKRPLPDDPEAHSIIAGYHWFGDWGRDTMIALPGLTLPTGRPEVARCILRTFARFVDRGMLPNRFPDAGEAPEYNTVDATLWYFEAIRQYVVATRDEDLLRKLYPVLEGTVDGHVRGTRYNIHVDPTDGLLYAGEPGVQLTWMDAKVGDWVVTPRIGKPVEVNALWYNALATMADFARTLKESPEPFEAAASRARTGFQKFWNAAAGYCFDVIGGPGGDDASLRPNQLLAVSLPVSPLAPDQQRAVVDVCARNLLTSFGLRSLPPDDPQYKGEYGGDSWRRDSTYHQGTVWGWLLGPLVLAHLRVYNDPALAASFLDPMASHLNVHGIGTASEIFEGNAPFRPRGCIAQAWTVGEVLRAWKACKQQRTQTAPVKRAEKSRSTKPKTLKTTAGR